MTLEFLWIPVTLVASVAQTARNALQKNLTATLGTVGATHVRFLYGLPFAVVFLAVIALVIGQNAASCRGRRRWAGRWRGPSPRSAAPP